MPIIFCYIIMILLEFNELTLKPYCTIMNCIIHIIVVLYRIYKNLMKICHNIIVIFDTGHAADARQIIPCTGNIADTAVTLHVWPETGLCRNPGRRRCPFVVFRVGPHAAMPQSPRRRVVPPPKCRAAV